MKGRRVQVFLRTPLYRGRHDGGRSALTLDVVEVVGTVQEEGRTGLHLRLEALFDARGQAEPTLPFEEIVLPTSKIDYLVVGDE